MSITSRPYCGKSAKEFDRIFKRSEQLYKEGRFDKEIYAEEPDAPKPQRRIIDKETGRAPSQRKLNQLYQHAKFLREKIKDQLCSKDECHNPTEENVAKMQRNEVQGSARIRQYLNIMKVVGAEPKDMNLDRLRRGDHRRR